MVPLHHRVEQEVKVLKRNSCFNLELIDYEEFSQTNHYAVFCQKEPVGHLLAKPIYSIHGLVEDSVGTELPSVYQTLSRRFETCSFHVLKHYLNRHLFHCFATKRLHQSYHALLIFTLDHHRIETLESQRRERHSARRNDMDGTQ